MYGTLINDSLGKTYTKVKTKPLLFRAGGET